MSDWPHIKSQLYQEIVLRLEQNIQEAQLAYVQAKESRDSDTKSSAGDKYETGREMMQREMDKCSALIDQNRHSMQIIQHVPIHRTYESIDKGALIVTDRGSYYMLVGLGKISLEQKDYFAISPESPIGSLFLGKKVGEYILLRDQKISIQGIY
ncbi:3-oxoacyl-ACP synthase [Aquirufa nivalisilvae]|uniref:3-oxoacyl-ACP synthase n=1 Tax=Aquirufa nivalisilvae TaxID=2516557 RepID=UPI0022A8E7B0|nr:3-oxoacyl-ACP synthase [Aquirufa nivalisilvae]MCZ2480114.1 3-oxoacyl-ACP synthase [Aquirufa nivalisilvae]MCZ2482492.1 3-oxoacyl-ACP synthase [Aquirufa nivalisilvae]